VSTIVIVKTRADFQQVSTLRIEEADILLNAARWDGAYYVAGYSVECALKSCVIKKLMATDAFPEKKFSEDCYTHDLNLLLKRAGLEEESNTATLVATKWQIVKKWSEHSRYELVREEKEVRNFVTGINDPSEGVLPWLQQRW
jgi:HEPN domain-containing protein